MSLRVVLQKSSRAAGPAIGRSARPYRVYRAARTVAAWTALAAFATGACGQVAADQDAAIEIVVRPGNTLIGLARQWLTAPRDWPAVAHYNGLRDPNRILPGQALRFPLALLASEAAPASVLASNGDVRREDGALVAGAELTEGATLRTGADGNLVVRLVDGSVLRLRGGAELRLRESRRYPGAKLDRSSVQLRDGRIEVQSPPATGGRPGFRVDTPQGVLAVRGTDFRVAVQSSARRTWGEVLEGVVSVNGAAGSRQRLAAGFGASIDASGRVAPAKPLLSAPDLSSVATLQQRPLVVFAFPPLAGAAGYRAQVARDAGFGILLADVTTPAPPIRIPDLADGEYLLRVRAADADAFEGRDAELRFTLKARPEPPLPRRPAARAQLIGTVDFAWTANPEARSYRWQLATDPGFGSVVAERRGLDALALSIDGLAPGRYHWRLASERNDVDIGPWGDALTFELRPTPPPAPPPRSDVRDNGVSLSWPAQPGQRFELQIARDIGFTQQLAEHRLEQAGFTLAAPEPGRWYLRLRVHEADGYVGPWGGAQYFVVPNCLRGPEGICWRASGEPVLIGP